MDDDVFFSRQRPAPPPPRPMYSNGNGNYGSPPGGRRHMYGSPNGGFGGDDDGPFRRALPTREPLF